MHDRPRKLELDFICMSASTRDRDRSIASLRDQRELFETITWSSCRCKKYENWVVLELRSSTEVEGREGEVTGKGCLTIREGGVTFLGQLKQLHGRTHEGGAPRKKRKVRERERGRNTNNGRKTETKEDGWDGVEGK